MKYGGNATEQQNRVPPSPPTEQVSAENRPTHGKVQRGVEKPFVKNVAFRLSLVG